MFSFGSKHRRSDPSCLSVIASYLPNLLDSLQERLFAQDPLCQFTLLVYLLKPLMPLIPFTDNEILE